MPTSSVGPHNVPDVWSVKKVNPPYMVHLTEKPVGAITPGDRVQLAPR